MKRPQRLSLQHGAALAPTSKPEPLTQLDRVAAELGRELGPLRLALADALNALEHKRGYHELGFSSLSAYATERAGKPKRWIAESRTLATNLEHLTTLRRQLLSGRVAWTRAELLVKLVERSLAVHDITNPDAARALRPALELSWFFRSAGLTCRELSELPSLAAGAYPVSPSDSLRYLTITVPTEDTWWFRAAERTFRHVAERSDLDAFLEALLAETHNTLCSRGPVTSADEGFEARDRWRAQINLWRTRAEHLCERARPVLPRPRHPLARRSSRTWPTPEELRTWSPVALDQHVLTLAKQLHLHAAALGRSAEQLHRVEAWRHLGFASQGHYARDRLGVSLSSLKQKRALARRLVALPRLAHALEVGQLGSVAASLVARVATSKTERRWVERARQRTVKHLREEVAFVERIQRSRPGHPSWPPSPEVMRAELALQGSIVNGQLLSEPARPSEHRSPSGPLANSDSRSGVSSESPASESPASESPASEGVRQHPVRRDDAAAAQRRQYQNQIRDYSIGVDAGCSPQHRSRLLPSNAQRPSPSTVIDDRAMHRSCSGPHQLDNCAAADSTARAPSSVAAPGQTSVGENPAKSAATAPQQWPRQCTADPTCTPRGRHPHLTGDGLGIGRTRLRLRVYEWTLLLYREVARAFARQYPTRRLLRGLCEHFLAVWRPVVAREPEHKYGHIYERDNYTCTSPVCDRHDVTPHHLRFRSRGGGDEPENLASLCVWCHLEGVHGGRLRAEPLPGGIRWTIGRVAPMRVVDRDKVETR